MNPQGGPADRPAGGLAGQMAAPLKGSLPRCPPRRSKARRSRFRIRNYSAIVLAPASMTADEPAISSK
jgi:hypothetical protein